MVFPPSPLPPTLSYHLVLEALNIDKLMQDVKAVAENPLQYCPKCQTIATSAVSNQECMRHTVYIEGTMILDIR